MLAIKELFVFILSPLFFYPYWFGVAFLENTLIGNNSLYMWLQYDSKRSLFNLFISDWWSSLPSSYLVICLIFMPSYYLLKIINNYSIYSFILITSVESLIISLYFIGYNLNALAISLFSVILFILNLHFMMKKLAGTKKRFNN